MKRCARPGLPLAVVKRDDDVLIGCVSPTRDNTIGALRRLLAGWRVLAPRLRD